MYEPVGGFTRFCRLAGSGLVLAPLLYFILVTEDGNAYYFLILVLLAPVGGTILSVNAVFCLFRYRTLNSIVISLAFMVLSLIGFYSAWYFLPQFGM
jgi:hypothetical protein